MGQSPPPGPPAFPQRPTPPSGHSPPAYPSRPGHPPVDPRFGQSPPRKSSGAGVWVLVGAVAVVLIAAGVFWVLAAGR